MSTNDLIWTDVIHADGTMLVKGQVGGLGDPANLHRVGDRTCRRARPGDHLGERRKLGTEGVGKPVFDVIVPRTTRKGDSRLHRPDGPPLLKASGDAID